MERGVAWLNYWASRSNFLELWTLGRGKFEKDKLVLDMCYLMRCVRYLIRHLIFINQYIEIMNKNILKPYNILSNHSLKCLYNLSCPWVYYKNAHFSILLPSAIILYIQRCCQFFKFKKIDIFQGETECCLRKLNLWCKFYLKRS